MQVLYLRLKLSTVAFNDIIHKWTLMIRESYRTIINIVSGSYFRSNIYLQDIFSTFESFILKCIHILTHDPINPLLSVC